MEIPCWVVWWKGDENEAPCFCGEGGYDGGEWFDTHESAETWIAALIVDNNMRADQYEIRSARLIVEEGE